MTATAAGHRTYLLVGMWLAGLMLLGVIVSELQGLVPASAGPGRYSGVDTNAVGKPDFGLHRGVAPGVQDLPPPNGGDGHL